MNKPGIVSRYASKSAFENGLPPETVDLYDDGGFLEAHVDMAINDARARMLELFTLNGPIDWDPIVRSAVPSLRNEFNTINFLLEFDDLPKLAKGIGDKYKYLRKKRVGIDTNWTRSSLNTALEVNLGWLPLYSDADTLKNNVQDFWDKTRKKNRKLRKAKKNLEKGIKCAAELFDSPYEKLITGLYDSHDREYSLRYVFRLKSYASCIAYGHYGGPNPFAEALDNMGLYPDLSTLWNAVPFSFIVDYFIPVGKRLEASFGEWDWQTVGLVNALRIRDACISFKATGYIEIRYSGYLAPHPYQFFRKTDMAGALRAELRSFERQLPLDAVLDGTDVSLEGRRLNEKQAINTSGVLLNLLDQPRSALKRLPSGR